MSVKIIKTRPKTVWCDKRQQFRAWLLVMREDCTCVECRNTRERYKDIRSVRLRELEEG